MLRGPIDEAKIVLSYAGFVYCCSVISGITDERVLEVAHNKVAGYSA